MARPQARSLCHLLEYFEIALLPHWEAFYCTHRPQVVGEFGIGSKPKLVQPTDKVVSFAQRVQLFRESHKGVSNVVSNRLSRLPNTQRVYSVTISHMADFVCQLSPCVAQVNSNTYTADAVQQRSEPEIVCASVERKRPARGFAPSPPVNSS